MPWTALDEQSRLAAYERIARFTVGIAANNNLNIGTGVLVRRNENRCILTAAHVIRDCATESLRFWLRPPAPMKEKAARDAFDWEIGSTTEGTCLPVTLEGLDERLDIGVLRLDPAFELPDGPDFYNLVHSREFTPWPDAKLEGTSLYLFGFPTENSRLVGQDGSRAFHFLGAACLNRDYSCELNQSGWRSFPSTVSASKDFLIEYGNFLDKIEPHGFSGCGVWVMAETAGQRVWKPDPMLLGITHSYFRKSDILAATKISSIIEVTRTVVSP
jgi:hypothetical protein